MLFKLEEGCLDKFSRSKGSKRVSSKVILKLCTVIRSNVNIIVRQSLKQRLKPKKMKTSIVVPVPQIKDSAKSTDLRPVNILSEIEENTEMVVYDTLFIY